MKNEIPKQKFSEWIEVEIMLVNSKMELSTICTVYYYFFIALTCNIVGTANTEGYKQGKNFGFYFHSFWNFYRNAHK